MSTYTILVTNNAPGCDTAIEQQLSIAGCTTYIVRLSSNSNALGPFNVYVDDVIYYSAQTRTDMFNGVVVELECTTPTPTPTPTNTSTPTNTPTPTITPSVTGTPGASPTPTPSGTPTPTPTPSSALFSAYLVPEPQDSTSAIEIGQYMISTGATSFFGYFNSGIPGTTNFASDMNKYIQFSGWTGSNGNFVTNVVNFNGPIRQSAGFGTDSFGCDQGQYTFGTVEVALSEINPNIKYFYSIWVPLDGVGGTLTNMTVDIGDGAPCSTNIGNGVIADPSLAGINVTVPSGCAIPSGTYRVLWITGFAIIPPSVGGLPLGNPLYFKGNSHT